MATAKNGQNELYQIETKHLCKESGKVTARCTSMCELKYINICLQSGFRLFFKSP